jgi:hypothetical protein
MSGRAWHCLTLRGTSLYVNKLFRAAVCSTYPVGSSQEVCLGISAEDGRKLARCRIVSKR